MGTIMGTLAHMAPEQAVGEDMDARSDILSMGVVLYEMATGRAPVRRKNDRSDANRSYFPAEGCWEITAHHDGHTPAFVVSVQR